MEDAGLCSAEDFLKEANTGDFSQYRFWQYVPDDKDAPDRFLKCEGYLFPDTYDFLKDDTVHHYVETFYLTSTSRSPMRCMPRWKAGDDPLRGGHSGVLRAGGGRQ